MRGKFYLGRHRVEPVDTGYWLYPNDGIRGRFYAKDSAIGKSIAAGSEQLSLASPRNFKPGHHEPIHYFRDASGKVGIFAEDGLDLPEGCTAFQATSLPEIDAITKEMQSDLESQFGNDLGFIREMDKMLGDPIQMLKDQMSHPKSNLDRSVCKMLIDEFEATDRNLSRIPTQTYFRERER